VTTPHPYRVVLADDVPQLRGLLRLLLERSGRFVVVGEAKNGREAVEVAQREQPHLTLLDLSMPVMDGLEALPLIRSAVPACAVVVLSGFDAERMADTALAAGAAAYLVKGIRPGDLVDRLLDVLDGGAGGPATGTGWAGPSNGGAALRLPRRPTAEAREFIRRTLKQWQPRLATARADWPRRD
jgi:DNA-binding NarL/FixJ family response regulator